MGSPDSTPAGSITPVIHKTLVRAAITSRARPKFRNLDPFTQRAHAALSEVFTAVFAHSKRAPTAAVMLMVIINVAHRTLDRCIFVLAEKQASVTAEAFDLYQGEWARVGEPGRLEIVVLSTAFAILVSRRGTRR